MDRSPPEADPLTLALQRELRRGERVLWQGRPLRRLQGRTFLVWLFAVPWTAFSLMWTGLAWTATSATAEGSDIGPLGYAFPLFGLPFIAVGFGMLSVPLLPLVLANRTLFAITDSRVLQLRLGRKRLVTRSWAAAQLGAIERSERRDGSGSLSIVTGVHRDSDGDQRVDYLDLGEVPNVADVEQRLQRMLEAAAPPAPVSS